VTRYLAIGCIGLALLLGATGLMLKRAWAANGALETQLASAQAVIDQRERDAKENAKAVAQLADKLVNTEAKVVTVTERIYSAPKTVACVEQPSIRAAIGGLRDLYTDPLPATGGRQLAAPVPAPGPPAGPAKR
jgi:type II secretory pathway pseudopilin PulG